MVLRILRRVLFMCLISGFPSNKTFVCILETVRHFILLRVSVHNAGEEYRHCDEFFYGKIKANRNRLIKNYWLNMCS
jgi:hypothetical protein